MVAEPLRRAETLVNPALRAQRRVRPVPNRQSSHIDSILELQRLAGNAAVTYLITATAPREQNSVQRDGAATAPAHTVDGGAKAQEKELKIQLEQYKNTWPFLAMKQKDAVTEIKEEARKPHKPSLQEQLLKTAAEAALGGVFQGLGELLKDKISEKITEAFIESAREAATGRFRGAGGKFLTEAAGIEAAKAMAKKTALFVGEAVKDAFAISAEGLLTGILEHLTEKSSPLDAFFGAQAQALNDAGLDGQKEAIRKSADVEELPLDVAVKTATGLNNSMTAIYAEAEKRQKEQTLREWFIYEAQVDRNSPKRTVDGTDLSSSSDGWGIFSSPGVLYLHARPSTGEVKKAYIKGTTAHIIGLIENKPIKDLKLPIIITSTMMDGDDVTIRVNEKGVMWIVPEGGGAGRQWLIREGGGRLMIGQYGTWAEGGDAEVEKGARRFIDDVGSQTLKGLLEADQGD
jgi:hypothetical protein